MRVRYFLALFIMAVLAGLTDREASAYKVKVEVEKNGAYAEKISDEMFEFARKETISGIKEYVENEDGFYDNIVVFVGMDVTKEVAKRETFILCKPYVYWTPEPYLLPIYMFPVAVNGKIVSLLEVFGRIEDSDFSQAMLTGQQEKAEEIESLNKLDYLHKDYVFFYNQEKIMAADENGEIKTIVKCYYYLMSDIDEQASSRAEEAFYAAGYREKVRAVLEQMDNFMYQEELEALREEKQREWETSGEKLIVKGAEGQVPDTTAAEPDSARTDKQDNPAGRNLSVAVVIGGVAVLVLAVCIAVMLKKRQT